MSKHNAQCDECYKITDQKCRIKLIMPYPYITLYFCSRECLASWVKRNCVTGD